MSPLMGINVPLFVTHHLPILRQCHCRLQTLKLGPKGNAAFDFLFPTYFLSWSSYSKAGVGNWRPVGNNWPARHNIWPTRLF